MTKKDDEEEEEEAIHQQQSERAKLDVKRVIEHPNVSKNSISRRDSSSIKDPLTQNSFVETSLTVPNLANPLRLSARSFASVNFFFLSPY